MIPFADLCAALDRYRSRTAGGEAGADDADALPRELPTTELDPDGAEEL